MVSVLANNISKNPIELMVKVSYQTMKDAIIKIGKAKGLPIEVAEDSYSVTDGSMFGGLLSKATPCLVIYNTQHRKDYYGVVVELKESYGEHLMFVHLAGKSKNQLSINMSQYRSSYNYTTNEPDVFRPGVVSQMLGNRAKSKMQDEELYYDAVYKTIANAVAEAEKNTIDPPAKAAAQTPPHINKQISDPNQDKGYPVTQNRNPVREDGYYSYKPNKTEAPKASQPKITHVISEGPANPPKAAVPAVSSSEKEKLSRRLEGSIGIQVQGGEFIEIIKAGTVIPTTESMTFTTAVDGQSSVQFKVLQVDKSKPTGMKFLHEYVLDGIPPMSKGSAAIRITVNVDYLGKISLTANETTSSKELTVSVLSSSRAKQEPQKKQNAEQLAPAVFSIPVSMSDTEPVKWCCSDIRFQTEAGRPIVINRETYVPTKCGARIELAPDAQKTGTILVIESINDSPERNRIIGKLIVENVTSNLPYDFVIDLGFHGEASVIAVDPRENRQLPVRFESEPNSSFDQPEAKQATGSADPIEQLKTLSDLYERGILNREEFEIMKKKIIY